jgi:hypothetical protein
MLLLSDIKRSIHIWACQLLHQLVIRISNTKIVLLIRSWFRGFFYKLVWRATSWFVNCNFLGSNNFTTRDITISLNFFNWSLISKLSSCNNIYLFFRRGSLGKDSLFFKFFILIKWSEFFMASVVGLQNSDIRNRNICWLCRRSVWNSFQLRRALPLLYQTPL